MSCETMAGVIAQDAHEHNSIVLYIVWSIGRVGEVFADEMRGFFGGGGARFSGLDDAWEMDELIALL